jgi:hypothetical protein
MTQPQHINHASMEGERASEPPVGRLAYSIKEAAEATGFSEQSM